MNVNLQPVSPTTQTNRSGSDAATANSSVDAEDSKGFLQTLSEVFSSGKVEKSQAASAKESIKEDVSSPQSASSVTAEGEQAPEAKVIEPDSGVDEVLELASESSEEGVSSPTKGQSAESESAKVHSGEAQPLSQSVKSEHAQGELTVGRSESAPTEQPSFKQQSKQTVMQEGAQILGQLEQSNAALKEPSGKALPQDQVSDAVENTAQASGALSQSAPLPANMVQKEELAPRYTAHLDKQAVSQTQPIDLIVPQTQSVNTVTMPIESAGWNALRSQEVTAVDADTASMVGCNSVSAGSAIWPSTSVEAVPQISNPAVESTQVIPPVVVEMPQLMAIEHKLENAQPLTSAEQQIIEGLKTGQRVVDIAARDLMASLPMITLIAQPQSKLVETPIAERQAPVQWTPVPSAEHKPAAELKEADVTKSTGAGAVAQAVHSALNQPNSAIANAALTADKAAMPLPDGINPNAIPSAFTMAAQPELAKSQVQTMQAALAAAGLTTAKGSNKSSSGESVSPQASSSLYSAQHTNAGQARVENVALPQTPMTLTREMAHEQVAEKVQMMMSKNLKQLDIRLDPPELGRMQIRMTMNNDVANVHFTVANPQAREMIEQTLPRLREMLAQQGMQLADSSVQQQASGQQQRQYAADGQGNGQQSGRFASGSEENLEADVKLDLNVTSKRDGISFYA